MDFIASNGTDKYYIQSAFAIDDEEKRQQELNSLLKIDDSFRKIVIDNSGWWLRKLSARIFFLSLAFYILGPEIYIPRPEIYIPRPEIYIPSPGI